MQLTETQHRILVALCRPAGDGRGFAPPATNQQIADEVFLSVDAVKAHLRTLYRKFGIEDLPHNQKRARLVELVVEGGYLGEGGGGEGIVGTSPGSGTRSRPTPSPPGRLGGRRGRRLAAAGAAAALIALGALALAGAFSGDDVKGTGVAAYRTAVSGYCRLALGGQGAPAGSDAQERARAYLEVIETVRGRVDSLPPPDASDRSLDRFRAGLTTAADFTSVVAADPPRQESRQQANVVAELTFAAGQVQAGALGYRLGPACVAIGDLVSRSARNAAHLP
jgi:hypothetical protein